MSISSLLVQPARALVVGGTAGIGNAIATNLIQNLPTSSKITIAGRNKTAIEPLLFADIDFQPINAALMSDVKRFSASYIKSIQASSSPQVDLLVMSQGILTMQGRTPTSPENIDLKMALHYYSRMLIIRELLPVLSPSAIILSILDGKRSDIHSSSINWNDLDLAQPGSYGISAAATHCLGMTDGLLQAFANKEGAERTFVHAYPGIVDTSISKSMPSYMRVPMSALFWMMAVSPEKCAENLLQGTVSVRGKGKGTHNIDDKGKEVTKKAIGIDLADKVWEHTWNLIDGQPAQ